MFVVAFELIFFSLKSLKNLWFIFDKTHIEKKIQGQKFVIFKFVDDMTILGCRRGFK